ncbi:MAG: linear amide C-N hydrolase [Deltaproteobacteria bacterium]|nr:linear amide C-N hydrolase [Deltaproteobacteria bacterium]
MVNSNARAALITLCLSLLLVTVECYPCTSFCLHTDNRPIVGKNFDWSTGVGLVIVNKRGLQKVAAQYRNEAYGKPAHWESKFGSVTFNQFGREFPMGGINEAGLVVELLMLAESEYPDPDSRPSISMLQWVQYQLDNFRTTREVIESDSHLRIFPPLLGPGVHYFVSDREGNCASIEFLGGKAVWHAGKSLPVRVLTNRTYEDSLRAWGKNKQSHSNRSYGAGRFVRAAELLGDYYGNKGEGPVEYAFSILENVSQGSFTKWSLVYDIASLTVYFRTSSKEKVRYVSLRSFDLSCESPVLVLDVNRGLQGNVGNMFTQYTKKINRLLVQGAFGGMSFGTVERQKVLDLITAYPQASICHPRR